MVEGKDKERSYRGLTNGREIDFQSVTSMFSFFGFLASLFLGFLRRLGWKLLGQICLSFCFFLSPVISCILFLCYFLDLSLWNMDFFCCLLFVFDLCVFD